LHNRLKAIHEADLVHGDIKPMNVLIANQSPANWKAGFAARVPEGRRLWRRLSPLTEAPRGQACRDAWLRGSGDAGSGRP